MQINLSLIDKNSHLESELSSNVEKISLSNHPTVVKLDILNEKILEIRKENNNVIILLEDGKKIILEDFFNADHSLVIEDAEHRLLWVRFTDENGILLNEIHYQPLEEVNPLLYDDGVAPWFWAAIPAAAAGIIAWAGNGNDNSKAAIDTLAPEAPEATINEAGTQVVGKAEAGSTVEVKDQDNQVIGSGVADKDGNFVIDLDRPLTDGEKATVTAQDKTGNTSKPAEIEGGKDTLAPEAPEATINEAGTQVVGKAEAGSTVEVKDQDNQVIGSGVADKDGNFVID
ncbi:Ig-like domain-containing protein, partial [Acinetobacter terrestris]|uniref:Ig-like domain-containing protein n=1 Tax=Acinetobacter terrestris TaxID=2529843 RepID=UPI00352581C7